MRATRVLLFFALILFVSSHGVSSATSDVGLDLRANRWIAYAPTGYYPAASPPVFPDMKSVTADLKVLRDSGFTGLITYGSDVEAIADVASVLGFRAMLLGVWNPFDAAEISKALRIVRAHRNLIIGLVVGNEGVLNGRYGVVGLCEAMNGVRTAARKPVTSTETVDVILGEPNLVRCSDFITVNAHPYFSSQKDPANAVKWTLEAWEAIRKQYPGKPLLLKEVGLPSAGDGDLSEETQKEYYLRLARTPVLFSYFEAFDATPRFKDGLIEQSWGLWRADRAPKAIVKALPWGPPAK